MKLHLWIGLLFTLFVVGCQTPAAPPPPTPPQPAGPEQLERIRASYRQQNPNVQVGNVVDVLPGESLAAVANVDISVFHVGQTVCFIDSTTAPLVCGTVLRVTDSQVHVKYEAPGADRRAGDWRFGRIESLSVSVMHLPMAIKTSAGDRTRAIGRVVSNEPARRLILASNSPRRMQMLLDAGYDFVVEPANVDEEKHASTMPIDLAMELARNKADVVADKFPGDVVLGADTVVAFGDWIIGKPRDTAHARSIIELLSGTTHIVITGVSIVCRGSGFSHHTRAMSLVQMNVLTPAEIDRYVASNAWHAKAGAYGIQDADSIVRCLRGDPTNVIGLPLRLTQELLAEAEILPHE